MSKLAHMYHAYVINILIFAAVLELFDLYNFR